MTKRVEEADLVDDAPLYLAAGIDRPNGFHEALQAVHAEQIHIPNPLAFEIVQHIQPKFAALVLPDPDAQDVLCAVHGDAQNHIGCLGLALMVFLHLVVDSVQKYEGIYRLQRPVLPRRDLWHDILALFS